MTDWEEIADWLASALGSMILRSKLGGDEAWALERYDMAKGDGYKAPEWENIRWVVDPASVHPRSTADG